MTKIIISERQYKLIKENIKETIEPEEAYREESALQTILDGKRGVGFIVAYNDRTQKVIKKVEESGLKIISMPQKEGSFGKTIASIIYSTGHEEEAMRLAKIARQNDGYLPTKTPEETYEIGILLGYRPESVKEFVLKKFPDFKFY